MTISRIRIIIADHRPGLRGPNGRRHQQMALILRKVISDLSLSTCDFEELERNVPNRLCLRMVPVRRVVRVVRPHPQVRAGPMVPELRGNPFDAEENCRFNLILKLKL